MSLLLRCAPSRWIDFLNIPSDAAPTTSGEDKDLFVGENTVATITLVNGTVTKFRDIVVLGRLTIQSSNPENTATKPSLITRDVFVASECIIKSISFKYRNTDIFEDAQKFRQKLQESFLFWLSFQKESAERIGLKSILI